LQEDTDALHTRVRGNYNAGIVNLNEARVAIGMPDLGPAGEVFPVLFNVTYLRAEELAGTNANAPLFAPVVREGQVVAEAESAADPSKSLDVATRLAFARSMMELQPGAPVRRYRDTKALDPAALELRASTIRTAQRDRQRLTEIGARKLKAFFRGQRDRVVAGLPGKAASNVEGKEALTDWADEEERLRQVIRPLHDQSGRSAFALAADTLGLTGVWDVANPNIFRVMQELGLRIVDISETTRVQTVKIVTDGLAEGLGVDDIAKQLTDLFDGYANAGPGKISRAEVVARTETMASYNLASTLGYQESGVVAEVELLDSPDHTESYGASDGLTCAERNNLIVPLADVAGHVEAEHPNGSLSLAPIISDLGE